MTITANEVRNNILRAAVRADLAGKYELAAQARAKLPRAAQIAADLNREFDAEDTRQLRSAHRNDW